MTLSASPTAPDTTADPAWKLAWLTPLRGRLILVLVLAAGLLSHVAYLRNNCPIDLSGDEAQYWDWSRNLDLSYYSKGPLVAYIIRASCAIFGETMPAVRYPALVLGVMTAIVTYLLTRKLFGSEKLALGTVLLFHLVPMFIAGSVLMTIDPPMFFCWALATYFAAIAIFDDRPWMWIAVGAAVGVGFLAKYAVFLWFIGLFGFLIFNNNSRRGKPAAALLAPLVALLFTIPVIIWNIRHDWVSFRHVARQTGASEGVFSIMNVVEMIFGQIGLVGPTLAYLMTAGIVYAMSKRFSRNDPNRPKLLLLIWLGLPFLLLNVLDSLRTKVQPNWPAPAYFSLLVVTAYFLATRLQTVRTWKPWRGWFYASILIAIVVMPLAHDVTVLFPILRPIVGPKYDLGRLDFLDRLRGWASLGEHVSQQLKTLGPDAFVLCSDYQQTAEMAFYVEGQPKTYCSGAYVGKRLSQYDMWPDRRLDANSPLIGRDAVYIGKGGPLPNEIVSAFARVERLPLQAVNAHGVTVKTYKTWRCYGFKGMQTPIEARDY